jgi:hypothetical protein
MAYKYKLVTEVDPSAFQKAASAIPSTVNKINVGKRIPGERFGELEAILKEKGLDDDTITDILDTWAERYMFVNPNEGKENDFMRKASEKAQNTDSDRDFEQEKRNKALGNTFKTPEELGKANLAKEVLNKLKNR